MSTEDDSNKLKSVIDLTKDSDDMDEENSSEGEKSEDKSCGREKNIERERVIPH